MSTGQVIVATIISQNGGSSGYSSSMNIDGSGQTIYWSNDEALLTKEGVHLDMMYINTV